MRPTNLPRLAVNTSTARDVYYLHYKSLHVALRSAVERYASGRALDIGCGNKPYASFFDGQTREYVGCDAVQSDLNRVDLICEATSIPLPDASFDTIFSSQTIEHVADHQQMLREGFRLLKPGGALILSGPFCWPLHEEPHDYFRFSSHGYAWLLERTGFVVDEITPNGGIWATTGLMIIHSMLNARKREYWLSRSLSKAFFKARGTYLVNRAFGMLDERDFNPVQTINYVVVAHKPLDGGAQG